MNVSVRQCAHGAGGHQGHERGARRRLQGGAITGMLVVGLGLLGVVLFYIWCWHVRART
jgi:K(+)-stimulated pyrophosphate-energized sodium pump